MYAWVNFDPSALAVCRAFRHMRRTMAENMYRALWCWIVCVVVTVVVSLFTTPKPESELNGLGLWGDARFLIEEPMALFQNHCFWAAMVIIVFVILNSFSGRRGGAGFEQGVGNEQNRGFHLVFHWSHACHLWRADRRLRRV